MMFDAQGLGLSSVPTLRFRREMLLGAALIVGVVALLLLDSPSRAIALAPLGLLGLIGVAWCVRLTATDPLWLLFALTLEETLPYANLIPVDPESRWWLRYPLLLALCIPVIPVILRSRLLGRGGFRTFLIYFGWGALTIAWSLDPGVSAGRLLPAILLFATLVAAVESIREPEDVQRLLGRFLLGCGILLALIALTATVFPANVFHEGEDPPIGIYNWIQDDSGILRFSGIFGAPNEIGALAVAATGAGLSYLYMVGAVRLRTKLAVVGCIAASFAFAIMADSRSSILVILVGIGTYIVWRYRVRGVALCTAALVAAVVVYFAFSGGQSGYFNRDLTTLTGRTEAWQFEVEKVRENPLFGYGYGVEGAIFEDRYFPNWEKFWNRGAKTPLHSGYLSIAVSLGLPALLVWIIVMLKPWIALFRNPEDPWNLKPVFFFVVLPMLLMGIDESGVAEPRYVKGLLLFACWMMAERRRLSVRDEAEAMIREPVNRVARLVAGYSTALIFAIAGVAAVPGFARAAEYYVDAATGNDAASGLSPSAPWRTLARVDGYRFQPGDIVNLRRSAIWRETLKPEAADHANFRGVTFEPYGAGAAPTINGSDALIGWLPVNGAIHAVHEPNRVYNVFVDGEPGWGLMRACCPASSSCASNLGKLPMRDQTCAIGPMRPGSWYWSGPSPAPPASPDTLYVWLPDGGDPAGHLVEAVTRPYGIHGWAQSSQLDSITIDGLRIIQTGLRGISFESEDRAGWRDNGRGINGLTIRNCDVEHTGTGPFDDGSYGNGITIINATAPLVENNRVAYAGNHGNCINVQNANHARILRNSVAHWNHNGIDVKGSTDVMVVGNVAVDQPAIGAAYYTEYSRDVAYRNNRAQAVHNGFQISVESSASLLDNVVDAAGTAVYLGPRATSVSLHDNRISGCREVMGGDGSGTVLRGGDQSLLAPSAREQLGF